MEPIDFDEANTDLRGDHITDQLGRRVLNMRVYKDDYEITSKWRLTWRERLSALLFGSVWLRVFSMSPPPVALEATRSLFRE